MAKEKITQAEYYRLLELRRKIMWTDEEENKAKELERKLKEG